MQPDKDMLFGYSLLMAHGWKYNFPAMTVTAPNGVTIKQIDLHRLVDKDFAIEALKRGGTPLGSRKK